MNHDNNFISNTPGSGNSGKYNYVNINDTLRNSDTPRNTGDQDPSDLTPEEVKYWKQKKADKEYQKELERLNVVRGGKKYRNTRKKSKRNQNKKRKTYRRRLLRNSVK